ncbi:MAG: helix-hairpin-helix domain-containing protein [Candidatus Omnitrophota bacterium]|nr:helix-hairpin-helix domain-containing protein [Candidatus Omnitrophota bacterium]
MIKLERLEKAILIFLVATLILGISISALRKARRPVAVRIEKFNAERYKDTAVDLSLPDERIDINTASAEDLMKIKGIGKTVAERIVEYRYRNGSFASIDDLKSVKGVGVALFEKIRGRIRVE